MPRLDEATTQERRQLVFLVLSGLFLGTLAMLNILGVTRFIDLSFQLPGTSLTIPMPLAVGVLPYPITFLCTDFISELYGRHRANQVVWMGLALNLWVMLIFWVGGALPGFEPADQPQSGIFFEVRRLAFSAVTASMIAYLAAQFIDVQVFHFWKRLTQGRHLWLRNNGSTLVSQLVDTVVGDPDYALPREWHPGRRSRAHLAAAPHLHRRRLHLQAHGSAPRHRAFLPGRKTPRAILTIHPVHGTVSEQPQER